MKRIGIFGSLVFHPLRIDNEKSKIAFQEAIPGTVLKTEDRTNEKISIDLEMDGYVTRLRISSNGYIMVSIGKIVDIDLEQHGQVNINEQPRST